MVDNLEHLKNALKKTWAADTSYEPHKWTPENPSFGQCAITACIVQEEFGGDILCAEYSQPDGVNDWHFWNRIDGIWRDLTRDQFPEGTLIKAPAPSTRHHILSYDSTRVRYEKLKHNLANIPA